MALPSFGITLGDLSRHFGVPDFTIRRLFTKNVLPEPQRRAGGRWRLFSARDVARIEAKLRELGYLPQENGGPSDAAS
jgi:DNA-binding transcriptional MerR regulator